MKQKLTEKEEKVMRALMDLKNPSLEDISNKTGISIFDLNKTMDALKEKGFVTGPPTLHERVAETLKAIEKDMTPTTRGYCEAIILLASYFTKADEKYLSDNLCFDKEFVDQVGSRLRNAKVWLGKKISPSIVKGWEDHPIGFYVDVNIALGDFVVIGGTAENRQMQLTESGKSNAAKIIKESKKS